MPEANKHVMDFLLSRRSRPAKTLRGPVPDRAELLPILTAAARSPDHGKLEPWRFIVLEKNALLRLSGLVRARAEKLRFDMDKVEKLTRQFSDADLAVAVVSAPVESEKVPADEQLLSAGAVCLSMVNAALASGWGANWLTGFAATDTVILKDGFGLGAGEIIAGFIHIGTETIAPPDRPRPDINAITSWVGE